MKIEWEQGSSINSFYYVVDGVLKAFVSKRNSGWVIFLWTTSDSRWVPQEVSCDNLETAKVVAVALVMMT